MAKTKAKYVCSGCGYETVKWMGKCPSCQSWNSLERTVLTPAGKTTALDTTAPVPITSVTGGGGGEVRVRTGMGELDNVLGGGLVAGSLVLLGGDPGVGKSTLLLMTADRFAKRGLDVLYVSGEESVQQIKLRADRLGVGAPSLSLLSHTDFGVIEDAAKRAKPVLMVVDSVQTVYRPELDSLPGSPSQVRDVAHRCMLLAKSTGIAIVLVGHVTKSGELAGPKVLEHFVDTVLQFEGDGRSQLRVLRSIKNRFGPSGELGMFEMADEGLREVPDASARLLEERVDDAAGTAVIAAMEGSRPLLIEVQALVGRPTPATPSRTCVGVDRTRAQMLAAVLEKHGMSLHDRDLFVNAAGGVRLVEPAADLGVLAALASSLADSPVRDDTLLFGEVGLVGEIRSVSHPMQRLREAARHGFRRAIVPARNATDVPPGIDVIGVRSVREVLAEIF